MESVEYQTSHCTGGGSFHILPSRSTKRLQSHPQMPTPEDGNASMSAHRRIKTSAILAIGSARNKLPTHNRVLQTVLTSNGLVLNYTCMASMS